MVTTFEVGESGPGAPPEPDAAVSATDDGFEIPELEAGEQTIELRTRRQRRASSVSTRPSPASRSRRWRSGTRAGSGASRARSLGAIQSIAPGTSVYLTVELEADRRYVLFDEDPRDVEASVG